MNQDDANRFKAQALSEEEIKNATVGEVKELNSEVVLESYNSAWPLEFEKQKNLIQGALAHLEISVEHVGSTSVPGMAAKPILDIVLEVPDSKNEADYVSQLEAHGYQLKIREPEWYEHRVLKGTSHNINLHVFTKGCPEVRRMIQFRDHLRKNPSDFNLYLTKKMELAGRTWKFVQNYADAKTEVIAEIFSRINSER